MCYTIEYNKTIRIPSRGGDERGFPNIGFAILRLYRAEGLPQGLIKKIIGFRQLCLEETCWKRLATGGK
jgi:hypothetical protein